jgi:hypothetical protein
MRSSPAARSASTGAGFAVGQDTFDWAYFTDRRATFNYAEFTDCVVTRDGAEFRGWPPPEPEPPYRPGRVQDKGQTLERFERVFDVASLGQSPCRGRVLCIRVLIVGVGQRECGG